MTRWIEGLPAARGAAVGPAWRHAPGDGGGATRRSAVVEMPSVAGRPSIADAVREAGAALDLLAARMADAGRDEEAAILEAQAVIASDPALVDAVERRVAAGADPALALRRAGDEIARRIEAAGDARVAARGADVRDVADRIARIVDGTASRTPERPSILVAHDIPPSLLAELPASLVLGLVTERGSSTSHAAIFARGRGIPMVVSAGGVVAACDVTGDVMGDGAWLRIDGDAGTVEIAPSSRELGPAATVGVGPAAERGGATSTGSAPRPTRGPGITADGHRVHLVANVEGVAEAERAVAAGAEGVGLYRTEALFLGRTAAPSEEEQRAVYRRVLVALGPDRPVVIRLADLGGDKAVGFMAGPHEANPFLGIRGIRLARRDRGLFVTQLRAVARAAVDARAEALVMAPMVATLDDVDLLVGLRDEAAASLAAGGIRASAIRLGAMIEVPSAALLAAEIADRLDFLSIGTNDLTQYTLAVDRGNAALAPLQDALHPAVLRLVRTAVLGAAAAGIPVAVCGEVAGDPAGALVLVGLGVDDLSVEPGAIGPVRDALAGVSLAELRSLADAALGAVDAPAVRALAAPLVRERRRPA
jgi:phosphoenolpyruvate-protein phosphotransferase